MNENSLFFINNSIPIKLIKNYNREMNTMYNVNISIKMFKKRNRKVERTQSKLDCKLLVIREKLYL